MARKEYKFNIDTLAYEEVKKPFRLRVYRSFRLVLIVFIIICIASLVFSSVYVTPKMRKLTEERDELLMKYDILNNKINVASKRIEELHYRDQNVYRTLFGTDSLVIDGINIPYPDSRYAYLENYPYSSVMVNSWKSLDAVTREVYYQSRALDDIQPLAYAKEDMALHVPAIWPVNRLDVSNIGAFNMRRLHPVYKVVRPHLGIDLGANRGKPVYATADGVVKMVNRGQARTGYGRQVLIDHGYGYQTRYAHLTEYFVVAGQTVKRGEQIGTVGSTGVSTGPHLHYEVIYRGRHVNPIMYLRADMSDEDFLHVIESAKDTIFEGDE